MGKLVKINADKLWNSLMVLARIGGVSFLPPRMRQCS